MSLMKSLIRPVSMLLAVSTVVSQPFALAVLAAPSPAPAPLPFFMPDDGDETGEEGADLVATQQEVFRKLFDAPWSEEAWTYPLETKVEGEGRYEGANQYSQPFGLDVMVAAKVELDSIGLPDDQYEFAKTRGYEYYGVIGTLSTERATVTVTGVAFSQGSDIAQSQSYFMLVNTVDEGNALFNPKPAAEVQDAAQEPIWYPLLLPKYCPDSECDAACESDRQNCIDAAEASYQADIADAQARFDAAEGLAKSRRNADVEQAHGAFATKKGEYHNQLAIALVVCTVGITVAHVGCAFTLFGALACVVAAQAIYAACVAGATAMYHSDVRIAEMERDNSIAAAQANYDAAVAQSQALFDVELRNANRGLQRDLRDCERAFESCLRGCIPVICGWRVVWIRVR